MKVIRANVLGFCMGVRRAVELAQKEAREASSHGEKVFTLGPLIHNPAVLSHLADLGLKALDLKEIEELPQESAGCSIIIRAHGIDPKIEEDLRAMGFRVIDATCPHVKASQLKAQEFARAGYFLFLAGEEEHAEIESIKGYVKATYDQIAGGRSFGAKAVGTSGQFCSVVANTAQAQEAAVALQKTVKESKTALLGQTTICAEEYSAIGDAIKNFFPDLEIANTICGATSDRQKALRELLEQVDAVIVAGGKESANTRRLLSIAQDSGKPCALAESESDVPESFKSYEKVGLCAGASTPDFLVDEIEIELMR